MLRIQDLHVKFAVNRAMINALNGVDLNIKSGQSIGVVGESGSGKSTLSMAIMGLLPKTAEVRGEIWFGDKNVLMASEKYMRSIRGREISIVFQNPQAYMNPTKTIGEQIIEPVIFHKLDSKAKARYEAVELLRKVGLKDPELIMKSYPFELSGGMLQRVMIAMALICKPKLLIADEPTTALDVTVQAEILRLLKKNQQEMGMAMILVTHDLAVAAQVCNEIYVMYAGKIMERIPSKNLIRECVHPYLKGLIKSIPRLDSKEISYIPGNPTNRHLGDGCVFYERCEQKFDMCKHKQPPVLHVSNEHDVACWLAKGV